MPAATPAEAQARLQQLRQDLTAERQRTARATTVAAIVGLLALIALGVYFTLGYQMIDETTQPERLVIVAEQLVDDRLPEARKAVQEQVTNSAPAWAEGLSKQAQDALPAGREQIEKYVFDNVEETLKKGTVLTEERFRGFLRGNRELLERDIQDLTKDPQLAEQSLADLEKALEKELQANMHAQAGEFHAALTGINEKLERYASGAGLNPEELHERRILLLARALQQQERNPLTSPATALPYAAKAPSAPQPRLEPGAPAPGEPAAEPEAKPAGSGGPEPAK